MPGRIFSNGSNVHDIDTGALVGCVNPVTGREDLYGTLTPAAAEAAQIASINPNGSMFAPSSSFFAADDYFGAGTRRYDLMRKAWERRVFELRPFALAQPNMTNVVYVDPSATTNGSGTFASPRNTLPATANNQTILLKECTTYTGGISVGSITNYLIGTYDLKTGRRVFDRTRIATIDAQGGTGLTLSGASINSWASGIRFINFTFAVVKGQNSSATGGGIEFCVAENAARGVMSTCFQSLTGGSVIRFNVVNRVSGDGCWYGQNTNTGSLGVQIYGNDIRIGQDDSYDGPDCVQLSSNNGEAVGAYVVHTNWMENTRNRKQIVIATYNNTLTATDSFTCYGNVCIGCDTSLPKIGANSQNGIYSEIPNSQIYSNYIENSRYPIVVTNSTNPTFVNGAQIWGNLVYINMAGLLRAGIEATSSAGSGVITRITNNTIIGVACGGTEQSAGVLPAITSLGPADIRNNVIVGTFWGRTIQVNAANAGGGNLIEQGNAFDSGITAGSFVFDSGAGTQTPNASDYIGVQNWLDEFYRPIPGTPLDYGGTPNAGVMFVDMYGRQPMGVVGNIGACHPIRDEITPGAAIPLAQNARSNYVGAWVSPPVHRLYTRFTSELAGGGTLTLAVKGKMSTEIDSSATTLNTITIVGGAPSIGAVIDAAAKDLIRVEITGYNAHGSVNTLALT